MWNGMLPVGSVVKITDIEVPVLITGLCQVRLEEEIPTRVFDYSGVSAVTGLTTPEEMLRFDREAIDQVLHIGYLNQDIEEYLTETEKVMQGLRDGSVTIQELLEEFG